MPPKQRPPRIEVTERSQQAPLEVLSDPRYQARLLQVIDVFQSARQFVRAWRDD